MSIQCTTSIKCLLPDRKQWLKSINKEYTDDNTQVVITSENGGLFIINNDKLISPIKITSQTETTFENELVQFLVETVELGKDYNITIKPDVNFSYKNEVGLQDDQCMLVLTEFYKSRMNNISAAAFAKIANISQSQAFEILNKMVKLNILVRYASYWRLTKQTRDKLKPFVKTNMQFNNAMQDQTILQPKKEKYTEKEKELFEKLSQLVGKTVSELEDSIGMAAQTSSYEEVLVNRINEIELKNKCTKPSKPKKLLKKLMKP